MPRLLIMMASARPGRVALGVVERLRMLRRRVLFVLSLRVLPRPVALFVWRAHRHARRTADQFSLASAARPSELAALLRLARGCSAVVELGTGSAWSAIALALDDPTRRVISYDPSVRPQRDGYLGLVGADVCDRIDLRAEPDSRGPRPDDRQAQLLFVDSQHERDPVMTAFRVWRDALAPDAVAVFHDYDHPDYPGVVE
ncbi:MAG TPA: class I SAM-dependent methyltransferase, partial [Solirubrobacteraceae bacterium]